MRSIATIVALILGALLILGFVVAVGGASIGPFELGALVILEVLVIVWLSRKALPQR